VKLAIVGTALRRRVRSKCWTSLITLGGISFSTILFAQVGTESSLQSNATQNERAWAESLERKAEQGNAKAQFELSEAYLAGHVFEQSNEEAAKWLQSSANQGFPQAESNLGSLYYLGKGVTRDYVQAAKWSQKAADQGDVKAQYNLGLMFALGQGVKKDNAEAVRWYMKAAEQGHQVAAYDVGIAYTYGIGIAQDQVKGYTWLLLALRFGYAPSTGPLKMLDKGLSQAVVGEAHRKAEEWTRQHPRVKGVSL
jgi:TPR repeat protein